MKKSVLLLLLSSIAIPTLIILASSFLLPLQPDALADVLMEQYMLEQKLCELQNQIHVLWAKDKSPEGLQKLEVFYEEIKKTQKSLNHYKTDWGYTKTEALKRYLERGGDTVADAYQPFVMIMVLGILFIAIAITQYRKVPFYLRLIGLSTGTVFIVITFLQFLIATITVPTLAARITGCIATPILLCALVISWIYFYRHILARI